MASISVQVTLADTLLQGKSLQEQQQAIKEGLVIREYLDGALSQGEVAELLGIGYVEARDWLHKKGIATMRKLPLDLEKVTKRNEETLAQELGI